MNRIVIGTRGSLLARWQAAFVAGSLRAAHTDLVVEEKIIVTEGDRLSTGPLWNVGGKGLWVKEIEAALLAHEIDLAVHSMKDVPGELAAGLALVAIPPRADVRDAVVSGSGQGRAHWHHQFAPRLPAQGLPPGFRNRDPARQP